MLRGGRALAASVQVLPSQSSRVRRFPGATQSVAAGQETPVSALPGLVGPRDHRLPSQVSMRPEDGPLEPTATQNVGLAHDTLANVPLGGPGVTDQWSPSQVSIRPDDGPLDPTAAHHRGPAQETLSSVPRPGPGLGMIDQRTPFQASVNGLAFPERSW